MQVGFDLIAVGSGLKEGSGGAPGYIEAMIPRLRDEPRVDHFHLFVPAWYREADKWASDKATVIRCKVPPQRPLRVAYEQLGLARRASRLPLDVLVSPANIRPLAYRRCNVAMLHAIQYFLLGDDIGRLRSSYLKFAVPRTLRTADLTITVTDTLKRDAVKLFGLDPGKLIPVLMGPQPWAAELLERMQGDRVEPYEIPGGHPYVMCISRLYALKNHRRLIEAYGRLVHKREVPHRLVVVGGEADVTQRDLEAVAAEAGVSDRVLFLGRVPQSQVAPLYAGASAIAYVSLYETFGHPVLEAFATETPLLTSSSGATAEVAGGAAQLADPESVEDIADGLEAVLFDSELRERLVKDGHARVREFSWDKCTRETVDVLERAVAARRA
jgi:glycosyltransferase involved in cell wall biosynthesis